MVDESKLVIACHCKVYPQMYYVNPDGTQGVAVGTGATYVDPSCEGNTWDVIPSRSKSIVWGENCPVYGEITYGKFGDSDSQLLNILRSSNRILGVGGTVIFPEYDEYIRLASIEKLKAHPEIKGLWKILIVDANSHPINLSHRSISSGQWIPKNKLIVFVKRAVGAGLMTRRLLRSRSKRNRRFKGTKRLVP